MLQIRICIHLLLNIYGKGTLNRKDCCVSHLNIILRLESREELYKCIIKVKHKVKSPITQSLNHLYLFYFELLPPQMCA